MKKIILILSAALLAFFLTASLDYEKAGILVFLENILILTFWVCIGTQVARGVRHLR